MPQAYLALNLLPDGGLLRITPALLLGHFGLDGCNALPQEVSSAPRTTTQACFRGFDHLVQANARHRIARMVESGDVYSMADAFEDYQRCLVPFVQLIGHMPKHGVWWIGRAIGTDGTPGQIPTQCQILLVAQHFVHRAANVRLHNGIQFSLHLLD